MKKRRKLKAPQKHFFHIKRNHIGIKQVFGSKIELIDCSTAEICVKSNSMMCFKGSPLMLSFPMLIYNNVKEKLCNAL